MKKLLITSLIFITGCTVQPQLGASVTPTKDLLTGKVASEKAGLKADEIVKTNFKGEYNKRGLRIEIQSITKIEGGISVIARAWRGSKQIGFGENGTVEWERFNIYNPPILVRDPSGTIIREYEDGGIMHQVKYREDLEEAVKQVIAHNISIIGKEDTNIKKGSIGNTTSTFYSDPDVESTSVDGHVHQENSDWDTLHDATSGDNAPDDGAALQATVGRGGGGLFEIIRPIQLFDTSAIDDGDSILSATLSFYVIGVNNQDNDGDDFISIVSSSPASNTAIATGDFDQVGDSIDDPTEGTDDRKDLTDDFTTDAYNDWVLNATGEGWVDVTGITKLGAREGHDILDNEIVAATDTNNRAQYWSADRAGTSEDPKLVVEHGIPDNDPENIDLWFKSGNHIIK